MIGDKNFGGDRTMTFIKIPLCDQPLLRQRIPSVMITSDSISASARADRKNASKTPSPNAITAISGRRSFPFPLRRFLILSLTFILKGRGGTYRRDPVYYIICESAFFATVFTEIFSFSLEMCREYPSFSDGRLAITAPSTSVLIKE